MNTLENQRVLIVGGGGGGIGRAITRAFADVGARIVVADLDASRAEEAATEIVTAGGEAHAVSGDVRKVADTDQMVATAVADLGGLDVLVTVVGGHVSFAPRAKVGAITDEDWDLVLDLNLSSVFRLTRAALRQFGTQGGGGSIVAVGSIAGHSSAYEMAPYSAGKGGLSNLAATVAVEYAADGVRMNVVSPGPVVTEASAALLTAEIAKPLPAGRFGRPEEIAQVVLFAAGPSASYLNGQNIIVDGAASKHQIAFALR